MFFSLRTIILNIYTGRIKYQHNILYMLSIRLYFYMSCDALYMMSCKVTVEYNVYNI